MQGQELVQEPAAYDARALRVEARAGNWLLVRGRDGMVLGKIGAFRGLDLATAVAPSPEAVREAREFKHNYDRGSTLLGIGIALWGIGVGVSRMDDLDPVISTSAWAAVVGGSALMFYGGTRINKGLSALGRSIWWYNRDLVR
ncbi:MAG TPA: hypothetical protein VJZ25_00640 [Gemmatimonadaceae bacterium]|nr:hypothetical protein [Gemmatimonadaceae bacterium]